MKNNFSKLASIFLILICNYSIADPTAIDNQQWCNGEVHYLSNDFIEFTHNDLLQMRPGNDPQESGTIPNHDLDDDWKNVSARVANYCSNLSISHSLNPNKTQAIFIGPDTFFDGAEIIYDLYNPSLATYSNHHDTYKMSHGIKFICGVCFEQTTQPASSNTSTF